MADSLYDQARQRRDEHDAYWRAAFDAACVLADTEFAAALGPVISYHAAQADAAAAAVAAAAEAQDRAACPVCASPLPPYRFGRPSVYCNNACRAAAYRNRNR